MEKSYLAKWLPAMPRFKGENVLGARGMDVTIRPEAQSLNSFPTFVVGEKDNPRKRSYSERRRTFSWTRDEGIRDARAFLKMLFRFVPKCVRSRAVEWPRIAGIFEQRRRL